VSPAPNTEGGVPRRRGQVNVPPGGASREENWRGANDAKTEKLRRNNLQRRARALGLELRESDYGYALIDTTRKPVDGRNDLSLSEVDKHLARS
jgi:hypothetical protein